MASYKVQQGDTLDELAKRWKTTVDTITKVNNIQDPELFYAGRVLTVPTIQTQPKVDTSRDLDMSEYASPIPTPVQQTQPKPLPSTSRPMDMSEYASPVPTPIQQVTPPKNTGDNLPKSLVPERPSSALDFDPYYQAVEAFLANKNNELPAAPTFEAYKPFEYPYKDQVDSLIDKILNREKFSYNLETDPAYNALRQQYQTGGNLAMRDTMGQAAQLSGGYGNSYASTVGNQAYQAHLGQLNQHIPELYQGAFEKYITEGNEMYKQVSSLNDANYYAMREHGVNMEVLGANQAMQQQQWQNQVALQQYIDSMNQQQFGNSLALGQYGIAQDQNALDFAKFNFAQQQYREQMDYQKAQDQIALDQYNQQMEYMQFKDMMDVMNKPVGTPIDFMKVESFMRDAYDKGMDDNYISQAIMDMYTSSGNIEELYGNPETGKEGLIYSIRLPSGQTLADAIYRMYAANPNDMNTVEPPLPPLRDKVMPMRK